MDNLFDHFGFDNLAVFDGFAVVNGLFAVDAGLFNQGFAVFQYGGVDVLCGEFFGDGFGIFLVGNPVDFYIKTIVDFLIKADVNRVVLVKL